MARVLGFTAAVFAALGAVYAATLAVFSLEPAPKMPAAEPIYESQDSLRRLSHPCAVSYAHRGTARWVQGCAK